MHMRRCFALMILVVLVGCGGGATPAITAQQVFDRLQKSGLATNGRTIPAAVAGSPFEKCLDRLGFDLPGSTALGVINICPQDVAAALAARPASLAFPLIYRSTGGSVIVAIDPSVDPTLAKRVGFEVQLIPE
jgi:hypothetical protein